MFSPTSPTTTPAEPYYLIAPATGLIAVILIYPVIYGVYLSFVTVDPFTGTATFYEVGFRQLDISASSVYMVVLLTLNLSLSIFYLRLLPRE